MPKQASIEIFNSNEQINTKFEMIFESLIEIYYYFIHHHLLQASVHLLFISSKKQLADVFTRAHPSGYLQDLVSTLKMTYFMPTSLRGDAILVFVNCHRI